MPPIRNLPPEGGESSSDDNKLVRGRSDDAPAAGLSQALQLEMKLNYQKTRAQESTWTKIGRELDVVVGGTAEGTIDHGKKALTDPATLVKFGGSAILATGLTIAQGKAGLVRLTAEVGSLALAGAFARDVYGKGSETWGVMKDTWNTPENTDRNKAHIKNTLGPFVVDFGIFSAGGAVGIGAGKYASTRFLGGENPRALSLLTSRESLVRRNLSKDTELTAGSSTESMPPGMMAHETLSGGSMSAAMVRETPAIPAEKPSVGRDGAATGTDVAEGSMANLALTGRKDIEIPIVNLTQREPVVERFPHDAPIGRAYRIADEATGKIEVLVVNGGTIEARTANAVALGEGKMVTNHHVVENATDIYIVDRTGQPHKAYTVAYDTTPDLAIVQLRDRSSYDAFKAPKLKDGDKYSAPEPGMAVVVGHYDGHNSLIASPVRIDGAQRQTALDMKFQGCITNGNCGGSVMSMDGELLGIVKQGIGSDIGIASPSWQINRTMQSGTKLVPQPITQAVPRITNTYAVGDAYAAQANVAKMFDTALGGELPPEFFHSRVARVDIAIPGNPVKQQLILKTQITPTAREVVVEPIALGGKSIPAETTWPGTDIPIAGSHLKLKFDEELHTAKMHSVNDPLNILRNGFNYRSTGNYLATRPIVDTKLTRLH